MYFVFSLLMFSSVLHNSWELHIDSGDTSPMVIELTEPFESCEIIEQALDIITGRRVIDEIYAERIFGLVQCL